MNTFGNLFRLTTYGESHGAAIGGVVDGMPAGIAIDEDFVRSEMARRRPGQSTLTTARREADEVEFLSGIFDGRTTGAPIGFIIRNTDTRPGDYDAAALWYRPSHADYTYDQKYGFRDHRGGGRSSARETAVREQKIFRAATLHFRSAADQARFILARDKGDSVGMRIMAERELATAREMLSLVCRESVLGYESSNRYMYVPNDFREKILVCRRILRAFPDGS